MLKSIFVQDVLLCFPSLVPYWPLLLSVRCKTLHLLWLSPAPGKHGLQLIVIKSGMHSQSVFSYSQKTRCCSQNISICCKSTIGAKSLPFHCMPCGRHIVYCTYRYVLFRCMIWHTDDVNRCTNQQEQ